MTVRIRRMRPVHRAQFAAITGIGSGLDQLGPADLLIALRGYFRDDQFPPIVIDKVSVAVAHDKAGCPSGFLLSHLHRLPDSFAGLQVQTPELTVAADSVSVISIDD